MLSNINHQFDAHGAEAPETNISIVIPVRNRLNELTGCLESLAKQDYLPIEVIVVDDGSIKPVPDLSRPLALPFRLHVEHQAPLGVAVARNTGAQCCNGDLILYVDSDCFVKDGFLLELARSASLHPDDVAFQMAFAPVREKLVWRVDSLALCAKQDVLGTTDGHITYLNTAAFAIRRAFLSGNAEPFLPSDVRGEDTSLLAKLAAGGTLPRFVPRAQVEHHPGQALVPYLVRHIKMGYYSSPARKRLRACGNLLMDGSKRMGTLGNILAYARRERNEYAAIALLLVAYAFEVLGRFLHSLIGMQIGTEEILGVQVACLRSSELLSKILTDAAHQTSACYTYLTAWSLLQAQKDPRFKILLSKFTLRYADGMGVVLATLLLRRHRTHKVTANDFFLDLCHELNRRKLRVALIGGTESVIDGASANLSACEPGLQIVLRSSGYLDCDDKRLLTDKIVRTRPHLVVLAMGQPLQEEFALQVRDTYPFAAFLCVGALFESVAGLVPSPPKAVRSLGFEWLFRMYHAPRRFWRRYLLGLPELAGYILLEAARSLVSSAR